MSLTQTRLIFLDVPVNHVFNSNTQDKHFSRGSVSICTPDWAIPFFVRPPYGRSWISSQIFCPGPDFFVKITIPSIGVMEFQPDFPPKNGMEGSGFSKDPGIPA